MLTINHGWKIVILFTFTSIIPLLSGACSAPTNQSETAIPIEVPNEGSPGEYIKVIIKTPSLQPCKLVLATPHKTEIENYLSPYTSDTLTIPNSDGIVLFYEIIPADTIPGDYILKVIQMRHSGDNRGTELFLETFIVR